MFRKLTGGIWLLVVSWLCGCENPTTPSDLTLTATPNPASAVASSGVFYTIEGDDEPDEIREYPWKTSFSVTVLETAGVGLDITRVNVTVQQASGGIVVPAPSGQVERYQFNLQASGNRVEPLGSATLGFEVWFDLPNGGRNALATVTISYTDDNDYSDSETAEVQIQ